MKPSATFSKLGKNSLNSKKFTEELEYQTWNCKPFDKAAF